MKVTIRESTIVRPSEETPNRRLWLSNLDLMFSPFYVFAGYIYRSEGSPNFMDTKLLKESLSKVLVPFYPLAGRLVVDENGRREVNCNGDGVLLEEAEADCPLCDYDDLAANKNKLLPEVDPETHFSSYPLLLLQMTRFSCGGVLLGYRIHHNVVDAEATSHFFHSWGELTRGQPISVAPVFDRSSLRARLPPSPKFHHVEFEPPPANEIQDGPRPVPSILKISIDLINVLKSKVNKEECHVKYSTFEILTAHLWRCSTKARNLNPEQVTTLMIPINCRNRLNPGPPKGYFGNVIFQATAMTSTGELLLEPLVKTIQRIREALKQVNDDYLRSAIDDIQKNSSYQLLQPGQKNRSMQLRRGTFYMNSWVTLPIFNIDFGWGKPLNKISLKLIEGMIVLLPCFDGESDLPVIICLQEDHKKSFETLLYEVEVISKI